MLSEIKWINHHGSLTRAKRGVLLSAAACVIRIDAGMFHMITAKPRTRLEHDCHLDLRRKTPFLNVNLRGVFSHHVAEAMPGVRITT